MARLFRSFFGARSSVTDEQLMWRLAKNGDVAAFQELHERWRGPILRLGTRMLGDEHLGEDLVQEVFARVYRKFREFDTDRRFSTWLWRIALNQCRDVIRRRERRPEVALPLGLEFPEESRTPFGALDAHEQRRQVRAALMELLADTDKESPGISPGRGTLVSACQAGAPLVAVS